MRPRALALAFALLGCGTLDPQGGGEQGLPNNRTGPFRVLGERDLEGRTCVLESLSNSLEDPSVLTESNGISLYATQGGSSIVRAELDARLRVREPPVRVIEDATGPSVVRTEEGLVMAFARSGRIAVAHARDGRDWTVRPTPLLSQDRASGETTPLAAPSLAPSPDGRWALVYTSGDAVWLAYARAPDGIFERVDGDPSTAARDPILGGAVSVSDGGSVRARRYADPVIRAEVTTTERVLWRVYAREVTEGAGDGGAVSETAIVLAASYDGVRFTRATLPALSALADPSPAGPAVLFDGAIRTWLFFAGSCASGRRGIRAAVTPSRASALPLFE